MSDIKENVVVESDISAFIKKTKTEILKELAKDKVFLSGLALVLIGLEPYVGGIQSVLPANLAHIVAAVIPSLIVVAKVWNKFFPAKDASGTVIETPTVNTEQ